VSSSDIQKDRNRLDKWLWCARLFKTRALATHAVTGGKVKVNGDRSKPAHNLQLGDRLTLKPQDDEIDIEVLAFLTRRGSFEVAQACYAETPESLERKVRNGEQRRLASVSRPRPDTRPDKRERRQLAKLHRGQG
jgi:ribosome-associated heat shock protein Hsp15